VELRGLGAINDELSDLNVSMAAISVDSPADSRGVVDRLQLPFPILADESRELITTLGLVHQAGGPGGSDISIPTLLLVDQSEQVLWSYAADRIQHRLSPEQVLDNIRTALGSRPNL